MSRSEPIDCHGAPRDLGFDQGRACADELRTRFAALPLVEQLRWRALPGREAARLARDLHRHLPHLAESLDGLASGAGVPAAWLAAGLERETRPVAAAAAREGASPLLARALDGEWRVRRSRPEGLFASVEVVRPGLPAALIGVNERGLAATAVAEHAGTGACAAPAWLLVQDCLERFEAVEAALEWCLGRPGGPGGAVLLADARGEAAGIELATDRRRVLRPADGWIVREVGADRLGKQLHLEGRAMDAPRLSRACEGAAADPLQRCLEVDGARRTLDA